MSNRIEGTIAEINESGDLVTDISIESLESVPRDESVTVSVGPHETIGIYGTDHQEPDSTMIAVTGSSGKLEIGIVGMNMSEMLGIRAGEKVAVRW